MGPMKILRQIDVFDNQTEHLANELQMDNFDLVIFKKRFGTKKDDPFMYDPYDITSLTADLFPTISFEFAKYSYFIACYQE